VGVIHSFIATSFVCTLGVEVVELKRSMIVSTLLQKSTCISGICQRCSLHFSQHEFTVDLYVLHFVDYDVILDMDWMGRHGAELYCTDRRIVLKPASTVIIKLKGSYYMLYSHFTNRSSCCDCVVARMKVSALSNVVQQPI